MKILFLGSPEPVIAPLRYLLTEGVKQGFTVVGVVTPPAKPFGRKLVLKDPPLASFAKDQGLPLIQTKNVNDPQVLDQIAHDNVDVAITAAFGQILSHSFLGTPKRAVINIHPSLLPRYRGATPIQSALLDKAAVTGVSILFTVKELDAGPIINQLTTEIDPQEKSMELTSRLFTLSGPLLLEALGQLRDPNFKGQPQDTAMVTHCKKIQKSDGLIQWDQKAEDIIAAFRAFAGWPGVYTFFRDKRINVNGIKYANSNENDLYQTDQQTRQPGSFWFDRKTKSLLVLTQDRVLCLDQLQPEGGKSVGGAAFWNGIQDKAVPHSFNSLKQ